MRNLDFRLMLVTLTFMAAHLRAAGGGAPAAPPPPPTTTVVEPVVAGPTAEGKEPGSKDIAPPSEFKLQDLRWQAMPAEFASAAFSPDGRLWYLMAGTPGSRICGSPRCDGSSSGNSISPVRSCKA